MWSAALQSGHVGSSVGPAYRVTVGLEPRAVTGSELGEAPSVRLGQQLFGWVYWRGVDQSTLLLVPGTEQSPLSSGFIGAVWSGISTLFQDAITDERRAVGVVTVNSQAFVKIRWYEAWRVALRSRASWGR